MLQWQRNNFAASLVVFLLTAGFSFSIPFLPLYLEEIDGLTGQQAALWAGIATGLGGIGSFLTGPLWGVLGDRVGRKPMLVRASLGGAIGLFAFGLAQTTWQVVVIRFFIGVMAGAPAAAMALVASSTPSGRLARSLGTLQAAALFGLALGPAAAAAMIEAFGYRGTFIVTSMVMFLGAVAAVVLIKEDRSTLRDRTGDQPKGAWRDEALQLLRTPAIRTTFLVVLLLGFGIPMVQPVLPSFVKSLLPPDVSVNVAVGLLFFSISVAAGVSAIGAGRLLARISVRRLLVAGSVGAGAFLIPQSAAQSLAFLVPFVIGMAVCQGLLQTSTVAMVSSLMSRTTVSAGFGVYQSVQAASAQLAPAVGGILAAGIGFRAVFTVAGAVLIAGGVAARRLLPDVHATGPSAVRTGADAVGAPQPVPE